LNLAGAKGRRFKFFTWLCAGLMLLALEASAQIRIGKVDAAWEDSVAVVRAEVLSPFSKETRQTLESGLPVALDLEVQFIRTGYVKRAIDRIVIEYNVWNGIYRVHTPIGPLAIKDYTTLMGYIRNDLIVTINAQELAGEFEWLVKVRAGERRVLRDEDMRTDALSRIEDELPGIAGWLFRQGRSKETFSDWSALVKLPKRTMAGGSR